MGVLGDAGGEDEDREGAGSRGMRLVPVMLCAVTVSRILGSTTRSFALGEAKQATADSFNGYLAN